MKGLILTSFTGWVEATRGLVSCDELLGRVTPELSTGGAYTSVGNYPSTELTALAEGLAEMEGTTPDAVMRAFGNAAFAQLGSLHPEWLEGMTDLYSLLSGIEPVIHVEVRKLYADSRPPLIRARREEDGTIYVDYESHRDLVALCHGLIEGAARHFGDGSRVDIVSVSTQDDRTSALLRVKPDSRA